MKKTTSWSHKRFTHTALEATKTLESFWVQNPRYKKRHTLFSLKSLIKTCLGFFLYTMSKTLNSTRHMDLGWVGKFCRKTICTSFNQSNLILDRSSQVDLHSKSCRTLDSNFTYKHILWASLNKTKTFWS